MNENKIARPIEVIETEINFYKQQTATGIIEIGKRLIEAKEVVGHGQWYKWLEEKVDFTPETARQLMIIGKEYGNRNLSCDLPYKKLFLLTTIPSDSRDTFLSTPHPTPSGEGIRVHEVKH